jgi:predicted lipoprotein with Yx(FWY)xxD motif
MVVNRKPQFRGRWIAALVGVALFAAGCGSSSSTSTSNTPAAAASTASSSASASPSSGGGVKISTAKGTDGTYLTGASGRALYLWVADTNGKSVCSGACAQAWPPLLTKATPTVSGGVNATDVGTVKRSNGSEQVTYKGHPLYYFIGDTGAGKTTGQGNNGFGAKWWLVAPSGTAITTSGSATTASSSGSYGSSSSTSTSGGGWS